MFLRTVQLGKRSLPSQNGSVCAHLRPLFSTLYSRNLSEDSDVVYLRLVTKDFVILNSSQAISDLVEKRSDIYSDRVSAGTLPTKLH